MPETLTVNEKGYQVIRLLGKGKGGYSYLVTDGARSFVLKQIHHEPCDYYQFGDKLESELRDYKRLLDIGIPIPELYDVDRENERILKYHLRSGSVRSGEAFLFPPDQGYVWQALPGKHEYRLLSY